MLMNIFSRTKSVQASSETLHHPTWGLIHLRYSSQAKGLRLSVKPFKGLMVSLPTAMNKQTAFDYIKQKEDWVRQAFRHVHDVESKAKSFFATNPVPRRREVRQILSERLRALAREHGFQYNKLSIRGQKTRWGSCSASNNISLNQNLIFLPPHLRDYILIHELAHTREKNHSRNFWVILFDLLGKKQTLAARQQLKGYEFLFYPPERYNTHVSD